MTSPVTSYADRLEQLVSSRFQFTFSEGGRVWSFRLMNSRSEVEFQKTIEAVSDMVQKFDDGENLLAGEQKAFLLYRESMMDSISPITEREEFEAELRNLPQEVHAWILRDWMVASGQEAEKDKPSSSR